MKFILDKLAKKRYNDCVPSVNDAMAQYILKKERIL